MNQITISEASNFLSFPSTNIVELGLFDKNVYSKNIILNYLFDRLKNEILTEIESAISIGMNMNGTVILASVVLIVFLDQIIKFWSGFYK